MVRLPGWCTKRGNLEDVLAVVCAQEIEMTVIKLNPFIIRYTNYDEILELIRNTRDNAFAICLIENMDVGKGNA